MLAVYSNPRWLSVVRRGVERLTETLGFPAMHEQIRPGGLGLHLIREAMDTVEFTRKGLTNQLRLVKYFAQASDAP
jgi:anti-sigma regulatory factor (Ser/Thr protein kinase)